MPTKQCWACRGSRAVCTGGRRCARCTRSNRTCYYGLRLSWAKPTNQKRNLTYAVQDVVANTRRFSDMSFVNVTSWDIQLHDYIRRSQGLTTDSLHVFNLTIEPIRLDEYTEYVSERLGPARSLSWLPVNLDYDTRQLIDYFIYKASSTLAIFEPDKDDFLSLLLRLALSDTSTPSMAVLQSLLALSSFYRYGIQPPVFKFKSQALHALVTSTKTSSIGASTAIQHITANMIMCHLEMFGMPNKLSIWVCHLREARSLIEDPVIDSQKVQGEALRLLNWVEYHMAMSRFSHRHWFIHEQSTRIGQYLASTTHTTCHSQKTKPALSSSQGLLRHVYNMFDVLKTPSDPLYHSEKYEASLRCLENKITSVVALSQAGSSSTTSVTRAWSATIDIFKISALIYLKRASRNFSGVSPEIDGMVETAYLHLDKLETFSLPFPLLIIGCEARTDEQRIKLLQHIEKVTQTSTSASLRGLQNTLQQIWNQDDLAGNHELDYVKKLDTIISSYQIMPSYA